MACVIADNSIDVVLELDDGDDTDRFINLNVENTLLGQTIQAPDFAYGTSVSENWELACNDSGSSTRDPIIAGEFVVTGYDFTENGDPTRIRVDATGLVSEQYGELPDAVGIEFTDVRRFWGP
jgi:hypothetical protein